MYHSWFQCQLTHHLPPHRRYKRVSKGTGSPVILNYPSQPCESTRQHWNKDAPTLPSQAWGGYCSLWWAASALPRFSQLGPPSTSDQQYLWRLSTQSITSLLQVIPLEMAESSSPQAHTAHEELWVGTSWSRTQAQCCRARLSLFGPCFQDSWPVPGAVLTYDKWCLM